MNDKIFALVDGSIYSASVCDHAAWIAKRSGAPVEVLHILDRREGADTQDRSGALALGARTALLTQLAALDSERAKLLMQRGRAILDDAQAALESAGVRQITTRLRHGDIVEALSEITPGARLIVIGKRGEAADFASGHLGSNLERILRSSTKPVLVASRGFRPIERVMVAFDGGPSALRAVDHIVQSPVFAGLDIRLVSVGPVSAPVEQGLKAAKERLQAAGIAADTAVLPGQPETTLAALVEDGGIDLVVMGAYGHSRIRNLIIGSTTTAMIRACKVPLLLMR